MTESIIIKAYDPAWPELFEELRRRVHEAIGDLAVAVDHVGSTAVPGLAAKPVIDIDVVVESASDVPRAIERLEAIGYEHEGNLGVEGRQAFRQPADQPDHHLYVVAQGSQPHRDHVEFWNHLRRHPEDAERYASIKRALARAYGHGRDREGYRSRRAASSKRSWEGPDRRGDEVVNVDDVEKTALKLLGPSWGIRPPRWFRMAKPLVPAGKIRVRLSMSWHGRGMHRLDLENVPLDSVVLLEG